VQDQRVQAVHQTGEEHAGGAVQGGAALAHVHVQVVEVHVVESEGIVLPRAEVLHGERRAQVLLAQPAGVAGAPGQAGVGQGRAGWGSLPDGLFAGRGQGAPGAALRCR